MTTGFSIKEMAKLVGQYIGKDGSNIPVLPHPDFWMPLSSNINLLEGFGDVTFTRAGPATYTNKSGELTTAAVDEPRFEKEGILIEGEGTNESLDSGDPLVWSFSGSDNTLVTAEAGQNIDGTNTVHKVEVIAEGVYIFVGADEQINSSEGDTWTYSVWVKEGNVSTGLLGLFDGDILLGEREEIQLTSEWQRFSITRALPNDVSRIRAYVYVEGGNPAVGSTIFVSSQQLEQLPFASSYIPTEGSPVTRAADKLVFNSNGNVPSGQAMTVALDFDAAGYSPDGLNRLFSYYPEGDSFLCYLSETVGTLRIGKGGYIYSIQDMIPPTEGTVAVALDSRGVSGYVDGQQELSPQPMPFNEGTGDFYIGSLTNESRRLFGHIRNFRIWHQTLTNEQIKLI